ncbi:hypothetical protein BKA67DRAFT_552863 [Truncatella angustata]|uniref:Histone chaperone domain-containing protein n=1 Tax=Truncatella angustata TaxID=152316 RepID=A0A9P8UQX7_9PEZI|nr:uncharacterized protein BKA67DRAFT_552863 [Truncatella angustata]KAH6656728.1 hypothetical protein BKA67DRAFT_552863 [Truncatella angustata]KAH8195033.1 hypothetical protein TruAng_010805 [Truncatella angustata]
MSAQNGSTLPVQDPSKVAEAPIETKGKGKGAATEEPVDETMEEDDDSSEDEADGNAAGDEEAEDNMDEIDLNNIVEGGRRTRGKVINWAEAAKNVPADEDEDDDDDFEAGGEEDKMDED